MVSGKKMEQKDFPVLEMSCAACAISVATVLKEIPGVSEADVNYANQSARVVFDASLIKPEQLQLAVRKAGYDLVIEPSAEEQQAIQKQAQLKTSKELREKTLLSILFTIPVVVLGMLMMDWYWGKIISLLLTTPVIFYFGRNYFIHAYKQALLKRASMDTLVALSTGIAYGFSVFNTFYPQFWHSRGLHAHVYFEAAAVVITFISLGKWLEENAKQKTGTALQKLMELQPNMVRVLRNNEEKDIAIKEIQIEEKIVVRPGEKIAVDGTVISGHSFVNESTITGEPIPAEKTTNSKVYAGTVNQQGSFIMVAQKIGSNTLLAHIIQAVKQAQGSRADVQKLADKVAGIFVPVVIGIATVTFLIWFMFGGDLGFSHGLLAAVTVLVIACPCALGLATPTAIMVGIGKGAENNILIKDAGSLELAYAIDTLVLDKTGTLTEGKPIVTNIHWVNEATAQHHAVLYAIEKHSEHPLAQAITTALETNNDKSLIVTDFKSLPGMGAEARINTENYAVGNYKLIESKNLHLPEPAQQLANKWQSEAKTIVFFANNKQVLAVFAITDTLKPYAKEAIQTLQQQGIAIHMLTGDQPAVAQAVAQLLNIKHVKAGVLPTEKADYIQSLQQEGKQVAMVGDGINDSQALALANVSIAMGKGSDIAIDVAKITLITSDLRAIPKAIRLSRKTVAGIRQNLFWAFIYTVIGIPIAAGILYPVNGFLLNPMLAGAAMALSSVSVVANSLRLKWMKL